MHCYFAPALLLLSSLVAAAPAATKTKSACAAKYTHYVAKFDDLGLDKGGKTKAINESPSSPGQARPYQNLFYDELSFQFASVGNQTITNDFDNTNFAMTANSGKGAIVSVQPEISSNRITTYYSGQYFTVNSFAVRGQTQDAFRLTLRCTSYPPKKPSYVIQTATFNIPATAYGKYTTVTLSKAQRAKFIRLSECFVGDSRDSADDSQRVMLDDIDYCFIDE